MESNSDEMVAARRLSSEYVGLANMITERLRFCAEMLDKQVAKFAFQYRPDLSGSERPPYQLLMTKPGGKWGIYLEVRDGSREQPIPLLSANIEAKLWAYKHIRNFALQYLAEMRKRCESMREAIAATEGIATACQQ